MKIWHTLQLEDYFLNKIRNKYYLDIMNKLIEFSIVSLGKFVLQFNIIEGFFSER
ncbi:hypothetical protein SAMN04488511_101430 [Pedobacter suwonensis]|uniref:Uncharacterized protein n=1 Tax=Pedobacter suwonensis TaxID=332999 RepID=A0A1I0SIX1_9SPHI|nr:hypothetical protein SAMN04488511_101430 [Pedobacter suwonensis]